MISFNHYGFESMTGEPNTWNPRVSVENPLPPQPTLKGMSSRGIDAAFRIWENALRQEDLETDARVREQLEKDMSALRMVYEDTLRYESHDQLNWHAQAKLRRAKRRETNLRHKNRSE